MVVFFLVLISSLIYKVSGLESGGRIGRLDYIIKKPKFCYNRRGQKGRLSMKGSYDRDVPSYDKNDSKEEPRFMN